MLSLLFLSTARRADRNSEILAVYSAPRQWTDDHDDIMTQHLGSVRAAIGRQRRSVIHSMPAGEKR